MSEKLSEIMKPIIEPIIIKLENERFQQGLQQGIRQNMPKLVNCMRGLGQNNNEIENIIKEQYGLTEEEVKEYI